MYHKEQIIIATLFMSSIFSLLRTLVKARIKTSPIDFNLSIFLELTPSGGNDELQPVDG